jgi:hypothetical protein
MSLHFRAVDGERVAFLLAHAPESAPEAVKQGIALRNVVATGDPCACGARMVMPNRAARRRAARLGEIMNVTIEHEDDCPAVTSNLLDAIKQWRG